MTIANGQSSRQESLNAGKGQSSSLSAIVGGCGARSWITTMPGHVPPKTLRLLKLVCAQEATIFDIFRADSSQATVSLLPSVSKHYQHHRLLSTCDKLRLTMRA